MQAALAQLGRRGARQLAQRLLPRSVVVWRGARQRTEPARIALTFDDGPTSLTPDYLAALARFGARGTFFLVGEACRERPDLVRAIADAGHELAGHGYTHRPFPTLSEAELAEELERTHALLPRPASGRRLVRPPYGAVNVSSFLTCARRGFTTVLWSMNSGDWRAREARQVARTFEEQPPRPGDIVLLHEGQSWTLDALTTVLDKLRKAGHELVTVGELLA
jgi:peptidoglycan-N-acetylglucosamine deacetylase